ncbi:MULTISPECIES: cold-shock protein [Chryseobacterium]|uniref:CspA family cold shock protein n=1 Tax=Chryseobacterium camelliae TaxID=1265445 RepID=A0ABU0THR8_9FLAO|nr:MULTISPECIES: cold shock domain-containing protein [Chryseobacterium]MDT3409538.1 CspA family cold shock protein [Pseudacidovorax intermedius]MDQ1096599.1 CspA family cold shock protein [Chryseobacterium camelliae]MDQ1100540.1 CspA family cold shock protein [Chryseobacterium sp. SORGH_AS_1048]MDR6087881.1 CspA family cold shock protein [Chryseobacterium sp. SORGH_AS_0909]MDR6132256.1 CspA family cold shock protein [Chryseobacterium sp. SORGH_AS_1175]
MQQGTVKFFNEAKGFGFISPADGSKDIFVHSSGLNTRFIRENDQVTFETKQGDRGLNAVNVKLA